MEHQAVLDVRREKLGELIKTHASMQAFADVIERDHAYVWQLVNGKRTIGEKMAAHIEEKCCLPRGWLSGDAIGPLVAETLRALPEEAQRDSLKHLLYLVQSVPSAAASAQFGSYAKMIQRMIADLDQKRRDGGPGPTPAAD